MYVILYNPLSRNGSSLKKLNKLKKKLTKMNVLYEIVDLTKVDNVGLFLTMHEKASSFVIVGGDGTLNVLANNIQEYDIKQEIFLFKSGTGNDFLRSLKKRKGLVNIKKYLYNLPKVIFNNQERFFLNGAGLGLDGLVVNKVNNSRHKKNKFNYFRHTLEAVKEFKPVKSKVFVDGSEINIDRTWLIAGMNDRYFGGGMRIAPNANRDKENLNLVIIKTANKFMFFLIFPIIYLGLHKYLKRYVQIIEGKNFEINFDQNVILQIDGEEHKDVNNIIIKK